VQTIQVGFRSIIPKAIFLVLFTLIVFLPFSPLEGKTSAGFAVLYVIFILAFLNSSKVILITGQLFKVKSLLVFWEWEPVIELGQIKKISIRSGFMRSASSGILIEGNDEKWEISHTLSRRECRTLQNALQQKGVDCELALSFW
jgi:hypothetical protein